MDFYMQAAHSPSSSSRVKGEGAASLHTTAYRIGPHRVMLHDASCYRLAELLAPAFAPFEEEGEVNDSVLLQLMVNHQLEQEESSAVSEEKTLSFDWDDASCRISFLASGDHLITITPKQSATTYCLRSHASFASAHLGLPMGVAADEVRFVVNNYLMMLYAFAAAPHGLLLFHASAIVHQGKAYLFLGKSGTGKSTHSRLWLSTIPQCKLLNDDNPLVEVDSMRQKVTAYGSPWSGKTPCYLHEAYPLGGIVRLAQAPVNEIRPLTQVAAFAAVMPSCSMLRQEASVVHGAMQTIHQLVQQVPVFSLRCLPNAEAALLSAKHLVGTSAHTSNGYGERRSHG